MVLQGLFSSWGAVPFLFLQHNLLYAGILRRGDFLNREPPFFVSAQLCYRLNRLLRIDYLLISQPLITVEQMDDATVVESRLRQCSLHGFVIPVGINADVTGLCEAIIKDAGHDPVLSMRTCHAMQNVIRSVGVNPLSVVNDSVGDIGPGNEGKGGYGTAVLHQQVAATISNVILYLRYRRMTVSPLMWIAILLHDPPPTLYEVEDHRQVLSCCFSDESFHLQCLRCLFAR